MPYYFTNKIKLLLESGSLEGKIYNVTYTTAQNGFLLATVCYHIKRARTYYRALNVMKLVYYSS
jgi:hypothetical protein